MKHLIITGKQATGKTLLAEWIVDLRRYKRNKDEIFDGLNIREIIETSNQYSPARLRCIFVTNENVSYDQFDGNKFLIIKLTDL